MVSSKENSGRGGDWPRGVGGRVLEWENLGEKVVEDNE